MRSSTKIDEASSRDSKSQSRGSRLAHAPSQRTTVGLLLVALAVLWQGVGTGVVGHVVSPQLSTFTTASAFAAAAAVGGSVWLIRNDSSIRVGARVRALGRKMGIKQLVLLNLVTGGAFGLFYIAVTLIPPTSASVLEVGIGPLAVLAATRSSRRSLGAWFAPVITVLLAGMTAIFAIQASQSGVGMALLGSTLSIAAGICAAAVLLTSRKLADAGLDAWEISAVRFHLVWVLGFGLSIPALWNSPVPSGDILTAVLVGAVAIAGPILLLQWGVTMADPLRAALVLAALPAVVLGTDVLLGASFPALITFGVLAIVAVSVSSTLRKA